SRSRVRQAGFLSPGLGKVCRCGCSRRRFVSGDDLMCPGENVLDSLSAWLPGDPQFQVLQAVVHSVAVDVVDVLPREQWASEFPLHEETVFQNPTAVVETHPPVSV